MKILVGIVRNLLLAIVFSLHFGEFSSSGFPGAGSSAPSSYDDIPHLNFAPIIITYKAQQIEVSFRNVNGHPIPKNCKVLEEHDGIPTVDKKGCINFITRALFHNGTRYCIIYEKGNGKLLGAKLPPVWGDIPYKDTKGEPRLFNPDASKFYITYWALDFMVLQDPQTENQYDMKLLPEDKKPNSTYWQTYEVRTIEVEFGGLYFLLYQRQRVNGVRNLKIVGADLDPNWREKLGPTHSK